MESPSLFVIEGGYIAPTSLPTKVDNIEDSYVVYLSHWVAFLFMSFVFVLEHVVDHYGTMK